MNTKRIRKVKSKGLGDTIAKVTKATGIDKVVHWIAGEDCGCEERRVALNKKFRYKRALCLTEKEYLYLAFWFSKARVVVQAEQQKELLKINNRVFTENKQFCNSCGTAFNYMLNDLKTVYDEYER